MSIARTGKVGFPTLVWEVRTTNSAAPTAPSYQVRWFSWSTVGNHGGDWRRKVAQRIQAGTQYTSDRYREIRGIPASGSYHGSDDPLPEPPWSNQSRNTYAGRYVFYWRPDSVNHWPVSEDPTNKALERIYRKIRAESERWNSVPFLAELRETVNMVLRPADALRKGIGKFVRTSSKRMNRVNYVPKESRRKVFTDMAYGSWYEAVFGWSPLISDVEEGCSALAGFVDEVTNGGYREYKRLRAQASGHAFFETTSTAWTGTWNELLLRETLHTKKTIMYEVGHLNDVLASHNGDLPHFLRNFGLTNWKNVVLGAWEVIPQSWLVDYFYNVNGFLQVWATPTSGVRWIVKGDRTTTVRKVAARRSPRVLVPPYTTIIFNDSPGISGLARVTFNRSLPGSLPLPLPEIRNPFGDLTKVVNMSGVFRNHAANVVRWGRRS